jgi:hypothetical protein
LANETSGELSEDLEMHQVMWAEMSPDIYEEGTPGQWHSQCEGDMDSDHIEQISLDAKDYPPGAVVKVYLPCCPRCNQDAEMCASDEGCDFNWQVWAECKYS